MRLRVDVGGSTCLGCCSCGERYLGLTHRSALEQLARHERSQHPEDRHARAALAAWDARHAGQAVES